MAEEELNFKKFPTTRYQGSKRKILPWMYDIFKELDFETALDACGGSGSVSYLLKRMDKSVTYNDKLKFNYLIGKALIENQSVNFLSEDISNLLNNDLTPTNIIQNVFKDVYYLPHENRWLDKVSNGILNMNHYTGEILEYKKAIAYYALFQASLIKRPFNLFHRNNLHIRTADVERNFGNKVTWEKSFSEYFRKFISEANKLVFDSGKQCRSINNSIFDIEETDFDLVYIDPPYLNKEGTNETANYLKCYHFLEGIANYDSWKDLIDFESNNLRLKNSNSGNDFKKENIYNSLDLIIDKFKNSIVVLSYKRGGIPSIDYLVKTMKRHKRNVFTRSLKYIYALNRQNGDAKKNREVLIIGS